ncbi:flotillin family protein [Peterkaempfera bronchialis]|uniref:Flotillin family protein n=1 Tax=Peterkaempfera bronchialis TaxID=2126346 RepID=A0A345SZ89_9ACTN|nr:flotillin family protein [Peterkaempfera bronchialis]AXI79044.1 flotillin family protein [Peterkaempfera bronchialis]
MDAITTGLGVLIAVVLLIALGALLMIGRLFRKVEQGKALIISKTRAVDVTFTGAMVLPVLHKAEVMDISVKTIEIARTGREGLICQDNIRADIRIAFFVRVNKTAEDVIKVAQAIGTERASHQETLQVLFAAKFAEALKTVGKQLDFVDLYTKREEFRDRIIGVIGTDLNGYHLEDAAIDYLEQTPMSQLDAANILDAQGIRKITELTSLEHVRTNEFERTEEKEITRRNVDAREAVLELERRRAEAEIKQRREIETLRAREEAEIARVQEEERLKAHAAHLRTEEQLGIQQENQAREIAVAEKNRERVIAVEAERIEKARQLEVIARERETALTRIAADKEVEAEKRSIADVVRERIAVEKTVAEQEEAIKRLRIVEEAERTREALVIQAEAEAQESLVKDIKAAEAAEQAAQFKAREALVLAESREKAAELDARAAVRLADAAQAKAAAEGLAAAQVRLRDAEAIEKVGMAEAAVEQQKALSAAAVVREKLKAEAEGLTDKAAAMAKLDEAGRGHEEYRLRLEAEKSVRLAGLDAQRQVAEAQAALLGTGLQQAKIDIVGGDTVFFDRLVNAVSLGKGMDGFVQHSETAQALGKSWLDGSADFTEDLTKVLSSFGSGDLANLGLSAAVAQQLRGTDGEQLRALLAEVQQRTAVVPAANGTAQQ